ncbi:class I glutamine amidotransferase-like protein [Massariosphaeria phaeospora]|uniref:Class I glutamine amidotransferase-like protein n=1 Tax=Massariosphaeria phaeospora TaxID=100035 RepID=A0A7C8MH50_9PLEO|nr:class I glutamine amidotransferase-like protein [Massariosphaeria phaeospora]
MRASTFATALAALPTGFAMLATPKLSNLTATPKHFGIVLFPGYQALDVFGPLDILNSFSMLFDQTMQLSIISADLEPVSTIPKPVSTIPKPSGKMNMTHGTFGQKLVPTHTFKQVLANGGQCGASSAAPAAVGHPHARQAGHAGMEKNSTAPGAPGPIEVLIIPGGSGTRQALTEEIDFVKQMYPKVKQIISVCTGATLLSRAGVLDGRSATSNKRSWDWVVSTGPNVNWKREARWVVDGNIWSSSGISAGMDVTYAWMADTYGEDVADYQSKSLEYERWTDASRDPFANIWA